MLNSVTNMSWYKINVLSLEAFSVFVQVHGTFDVCCSPFQVQCTLDHASLESSDVVWQLTGQLICTPFQSYLF